MCGFLDLSCYVCKFCQIVVPIIKALPEADCDNNCGDFAKIEGKGTQDPIAQAVEAGCLSLCPAIFSSVIGATAHVQCQDAQQLVLETTKTTTPIDRID
jgi:hypothetical protein